MFISWWILIPLIILAMVGMISCLAYFYIWADYRVTLYEIMKKDANKFDTP